MRLNQSDIDFWLTFFPVNPIKSRQLLCKPWKDCSILLTLSSWQTRFSNLLKRFSIPMHSTFKYIEMMFIFTLRFYCVSLLFDTILHYWYWPDVGPDDHCLRVEPLHCHPSCLYLALKAENMALVWNAFLEILLLYKMLNIKSFSFDDSDLYYLLT